MNETKILMVCLGNICRSPVAHGLLDHKAKSSELPVWVDSCGTSNYHEGNAPDPRSQANALKNGLDISSLRSRPFVLSDFDEFDHIYCMDASNLGNVLALARHSADRDKVKLILADDNQHKGPDVPDPYFGAGDGFQGVYDLLDIATDKIIADLKPS